MAARLYRGSYRRRGLKSTVPGWQLAVYSRGRGGRGGEGGEAGRENSRNLTTPHRRGGEKA